MPEYRQRRLTDEPEPIKDAVLEFGRALKDAVHSVGEQRRDAGIERVTQNNKRWHDRAIDALLAMPIGAEITSDDLHLALGEDKPGHQNAYGAAMRHAADGMEILLVIGFDKSKRPSANARRILRYRRTDRHADTP